MKRWAVISESLAYRYSLGRSWGHETNEQPVPLAFLMLNPSTADADVDDPTIRRCIGFAKGWGFNELTVINLFAYRSTEPRDLLNEHQRGGMRAIVGPENNEHIRRETTPLFNVVLAWGAFNPGRWRRAFQDRVSEVLALVTPGNKLWTIGKLTKGGAPRHPLYLPAAEKLVPWRGLA